jgi:hypothetical protein
VVKEEKINKKETDIFSSELNCFKKYYSTKIKNILIESKRKGKK